MISSSGGDDLLVTMIVLQTLAMVVPMAIAGLIGGTSAEEDTRSGGATVHSLSDRRDEAQTRRRRAA